MSPAVAPLRRPPDVPALLAVLAGHAVRHVVVGSVAANLHGVALEPGDLDVVPELSRENLARLAAALELLHARPVGPFGHWERDAHDEWRWIARETSAAELAAWRPDPDRPATFDNLLATRHGDLDLVPRIAGSFEELATRAVSIEAHGMRLRVAGKDDLLDRLTRPRRDKDVSRVAALRRLRRTAPASAPVAPAASPGASAPVAPAASPGASAPVVPAASPMASAPHAGVPTSPALPRVLGLHHAQVMVPREAEAEARRFYSEVLGLQEVPKPAPLVARGGFWLQLPGIQVHVGLEDRGHAAEDRASRAVGEVREVLADVSRAAASRAHLAYAVDDLAAWRARLAAHGIALLDGVPIPGWRRAELRDPFGNRIELLQRDGAESPG